MKNVLKVLAVFALALIVVGSFGDNTAMAAGQGVNYIDEDGDGICDNCLINCARQIGRKQMRGQGSGQGLRENFVDEDNDGVCDNLADRPMDGTGRKNGRGRNR